MNKILYTKFSNERSPEFALQTQIIQNEQGIKKVKKCIINDEAKEYVFNMERWYQELSQDYKNSSVSFAQCTKEDDGVSFEFVQGTSLEIILDNLLYKKNFNELFNTIQSYFNILRKYNSNTQFVKSEKYVEIFGDFDFNEIMYCNTINNIDMIFSNVFVNDGKLKIIDYEWTFELLIPLDFILYRILYNYIYFNPSREILIKEGIWDLLGNSKKYLDIFKQMENNFQNYIYRNITTTQTLYRDMKHDNINVLQMINEKNKIFGDSRVQIYKDFGSDFSENNSTFIVPLEKENRFSICLPIENNVSRIRFDPCNRCCMIIFSKFEDDKGNNYLDQLSSIGYKLNGHCYLFNNDDPWVSCILLDSTKELLIEYELIKGNNLEVFLNKLSLELDKQIQLKNKINLMSEEINVLSNNNDILNQEIINMKNTLSWRITKPLRKIRNYFK